MKSINLGVIGLGQRGFGMLKGFMLFDNVNVVALSDNYEKHLLRASEEVEKTKGNKPALYEDYEQLLNDKNVQVVYIASSWDEHIRMAIKSMKKGIITAIEVGGAYDVEECWELVRAYEETKTPIMLMENCCFDYFELLATTLARRKMLGEIVHCHGSYSHDLRPEILGGNLNHHYRLLNYMKRNCENYPTHEFGPIAKILNINRGNRIMTLSSLASKGVGIEELLKEGKNPDTTLNGVKFNQGDLVHTMIKCANGETVTLTLDTTLPRFYSREFTVRGTKGLCMQETDLVMIEGTETMKESWDASQTLKEAFGNAKAYKHLAPDIWQNITEEEANAGHGGMDYLMIREFLKCIDEGKEFPIDVYDAATWMCITALSEQSVALSGAPVPVPDFTRGKWIMREPKDVVPLKLD